MSSPLLQPITVALHSKRQEALANLKLIDAVRVREKVKRDKETFYVVEIHLRPHTSNIPSAIKARKASPAVDAAKKASLDEREPEVRLEKTFTEFFTLRSTITSYAFTCRKSKRCRLCQVVFEYQSQMMDKTPPSMIRALGSKGTKMRIVEDIVNDLLAMVTPSQIDPSRKASSCEGNEQIPIVLADFLRP